MRLADGVTTNHAPARLEQLRQIARLWDELVPLPFLDRRIGLDALVGLVPGVGDVAGALVAGWGLVVAVRMGAPASVTGRMLLNITIDTLVGAIPLLGDIFDIGWRAQRRNVTLLERWLDDPARATRRSTAFLVAIAAAMIALMLATVWLVAWIFTRLMGGVAP